MTEKALRPVPLTRGKPTQPVIRWHRLRSMLSVSLCDEYLYKQHHQTSYTPFQRMSLLLAPTYKS